MSNRGRGVRAAYRPFKPGGGGSNPSGPNCGIAAIEQENREHGISGDGAPSYKDCLGVLTPCRSRLRPAISRLKIGGQSPLLQRLPWRVDSLLGVRRSLDFAARSSRAEHSADNRKTKVQLLPGRLMENDCRDGTKALEAERLALNQKSEGSSPSGPTDWMKHWSSSGQDSAPVMRGRGFESHPVLCL